jgi:flagellin
MTKMSEAMSLLGGKCFASGGTDISNADYAEYAVSSTINGSSWVYMTNEYGSDISLSITCENANLANALGLGGAAVDDGLVVQGSDVQADFTTDANGDRIGFAKTATIATEGNKITVKDVDNKTFIVKVPGNLAGTTWSDVKGGTTGVTSSSNSVSTATGAATKDFVQQVTDIGAMKVHVGANEDQYIEVEIPEISTNKLDLDDINVMTFDNAGRSIEKVDNAIARVSEIRSLLGAYSNRIEHTQNNLATSNENMTTALSGLMDTDMAEEMTEYTSQNVLAQAGTSILSQANARPETVLQLLDH